MTTPTRRLARLARFARALRSRPFALLWAGQTVSSLGDGAFSTALVWTVLLLAHSGTALAGTAIAQSAALVLFVLVGGVVADRLPRRLVLLWADGGRALVVLTIAALAALGLLQYWHLLALALLFGLGDAFFTPAYQAIAPQVVATEALPSANALTALGGQIGGLGGPIIGAACIALAGPSGAFGFDGLTFVVSVLCLVAMRAWMRTGAASASKPAEPAERPSSPDASEAVATPEPGTRRGLGGVLADVGEGLGYIRGSTWLWVNILLFSAGNIGIVGALGVALPKLIHDAYGQGVWLLGTVGTAGAIGSMIGAVVVGQLRRLGHRGPVAYGTLMLACLGLVVYGLPLPHDVEPAAAVAAALMFGFGIAAFNTVWFTVLQELVPADKLGRVSSVDWMGSFALTPVGYALAGVLTDRVGPSWVFLGAGILNLTLCAVGLAVPAVRHLE